MREVSGPFLRTHRKIELYTLGQVKRARYFANICKLKYKYKRNKEAATRTHFPFLL